MAYDHRGRIKLIGSSRGRGLLRTPSGEVRVAYQVDSFLERGRTIVSGSLDGDASFAADGEAGVLRLESGEEIEIVLVKPDEDGVDFKSAA